MLRKKNYFLVFLIIVFVVISQISILAQVRDMTIKAAWGETLDPWSHGQSAFFNVLKYRVESMSNGKMKVELLPSDSVGTAPQRLDLLVRNTIQVTGSLPLGVIASKYAPIADYATIPYLFSNALVALEVMKDPEISGYLNKRVIEDCGIRLMPETVQWEGLRYFTTKNKLITKPEDLKGLKIRVMEGKMYVKTMQALGANPVPIPWAELYTALQTNMVDGQENPPANIIYKSMQEVQNYMSGPGPFLAGGTALLKVNNEWWESLNPEEQLIFTEACKYAIQAHRGIFEVKNMEAMSKLSKDFKEIYLFDSKTINKFREKCQGPAIEYLKSKLNTEEQEFIDKLLKKVSLVEEELGYK
ncbi:TRAP transporter substrate-binding protein [Candidatus Atribacteria bacterium 1244-E10-H5-B2]|nr:MAG: TRAP transporter substrate-binding protein [Candidatus Atribacteria bacterium 1244-E10-H5-B2]